MEIRNVSVGQGAQTMSPTLFDAPKETRMGKHALLVECEQHGAEWFSVRLGKPTASKFSAIITPGSKPTTGGARQTYMNQLLAERITRCLHNNYKSAPMDHGNALEPKGRGYYAMTTGRDVQQVGFVMHESRSYGCSPDGLVDDNLVLEIKCPYRHTFVGLVLAEKPVWSAYKVQIQAQMWITERPACEFLLYTEDNNLTPIIERVPADPAMHEIFAEAIPAFVRDLDAAEAAVRRAMQ